MILRVPDECSDVPAFVEFMYTLFNRVFNLTPQKELAELNIENAQMIVFSQALSSNMVNLKNKLFYKTQKYRKFKGDEHTMKR